MLGDLTRAERAAVTLLCKRYGLERWWVVECLAGERIPAPWLERAIATAVRNASARQA